MCTNENRLARSENLVHSTILPFGSSTPESGGAIAMESPDSMTMPNLDQYRLHLYNYALQAERLRFHYSNNNNNSLLSNNNGAPAPPCPFPSAYNPRWTTTFPMTFLQHRLQQDEPKPQHSYIGLIAMAILSSPEMKLVLSDIYQFILDNYPYFRTRGPGWRNSIRHNLSLNDCFVKAGRSANGKGHYWAIHPANVEDFKKGDFRRRKAQRKVRKHMGLAVDDDGNDSPSPPPIPAPMWTNVPVFPTFRSVSKKRQFDVDSLLAPDEEEVAVPAKKIHLSSSEDEDHVDVVTNDPKKTMPPPALPDFPPKFPLPAAFPWCYPGILPAVDPNLMARYYERVQNQARTLQLYQHLQMQRRCAAESQAETDP